MTPQQIQQMLELANWDRRTSDRGAMVSACLPQAIREAQVLHGGGNAPIHYPHVRVSAEQIDGSAVLQQVRGYTTALRASFEDVLEDVRMTRVMPSRSGRRLLRDAGSRLARGNTKIFRRESERQDVNASIFFLLDKSGSMKLRIHRAAQAVLLFCDALEDVDGVEVAVAAFPHTVNGDKHGVQLLKDFDEGSRKWAGRIGALSANGATPMASAMLYAQTLLAQASEKSEHGRRIVIAATDGRPSFESQVRAVMAHGLEGVEYVGIGIGVDVSHLFPVAIQIDTVDELPRKALELAKQILFVRDHENQ